MQATMMKFISIILAALITFTHGEWRQEGPCNVSYTSNKGTEFILAFMKIYNGHGIDTFDVKIFVSSFKNVFVDIDAPNLGFKRTFTVTERGIHEIILEKGIRQSATGIFNKGVLIRSSSPISVYSRTDWSGPSIGFTALPTESLSTKYIISSYMPMSGEYSLFSVAGIHDGTLVSIKFNTSGDISYENNIYKSGDTMQIHLERLQTFLLQHTEDLSGTIVIGTMPIAVFSGGLSVLPETVGGSILLSHSQLVPIEHWDTDFIITPATPQLNSFIRIYTFYHNTSISLRNSSFHHVTELEYGGFIEGEVGNEPVVVHSSKPTFIVQYTHGYTHTDIPIYEDVLMMIVPGVNQYSSDYIYPIITDANFINYAIIIVKNDSLPGLQFSADFKTEVIIANGDDYVAGIANSYNILEHRDGSVKFGALVFGFGNGTGFGFPAGMVFADKKICPTATITAIPTTPVMLAPSQGTGLVCFSCSDMIHLRYCNLVEQCKENLGCFVERYYVGNHPRFSSGCITKNYQVCDSAYNVDGRCTKCCYTSYCNSNGCEDNGFASRDSRGPLCYKCNYLGNPQECTNIQQCEHVEVCHIEGTLWGDKEQQYSMGCRNRIHCSSINAIVGRSVSTCSRCCDDDFCNLNCTTHYQTPFIG